MKGNYQSIQAVGIKAQRRTRARTRRQNKQHRRTHVVDEKVAGKLVAEHLCDVRADARARASGEALVQQEAAQLVAALDFLPDQVAVFLDFDSSFV